MATLPNSAYVPTASGQWSGGSHIVNGVQLVPGAPGYDPVKAAPWLSQISRTDPQLNAYMSGASVSQALSTPYTEGWSGSPVAVSESKESLLQKQLDALQKQYDSLVSQNRSQSGGGIVGGGVVDDGSTFNPGGTGGLGTGGVVYGPDGTSYSSAAAAIAAGVTNFTYTKPVIPQTPAGPGLIQGADNLTAVPPGVTGNTNFGGLIANTNQQLFNAGPARVALPSGVSNPFAV